MHLQTGVRTCLTERQPHSFVDSSDRRSAAFRPILLIKPCSDKDPFHLCVCVWGFFFYLRKFASLFCLFSFFPPPQLESQKKIRVTPTGTESPSSSLHPSSGVTVMKCSAEVKSKRSNSFWGWRRQSLLSGGMSPAVACQGLQQKVGSLSVPALCRLYFLIPNLHQPPHNNMADPACGTGATAHSWRHGSVRCSWSESSWGGWLGGGGTRRPPGENRHEINKIIRRRRWMRERKRSGAEDGFVEEKKKEDSKRPQFVQFSGTSTDLWLPLLAKGLVLQRNTALTAVRTQLHLN